MRVTASAILMLLFVCLSCDEEEPLRPAVPVQQEFVISGAVTDSATATPIKGVFVSFFVPPASGRFTTTDSLGVYHLRWIEEKPVGSISFVKATYRTKKYVFPDDAVQVQEWQYQLNVELAE